MDETDYFVLSAIAARRLKTSPATLIRFETIRLQLAAHGIRPDDKRIPLWIAPILCTTPETRRLFLEGFPEEQADVAQPSTKRPGSAAAESHTIRKSATRRQIGWRPASLLASVLAIPIAALFLLPLISHEPQGVNRPVEVPTTNSSQANSSLQSPPTQTLPDESNVTIWLLLGVPALIAIGYIVWLRRRRRTIRRDNAPAPDRSVKLAFATGLQNLFTERSLRKALGNLRRHRPVVSTKLNIPAAIRATIRSAGFPQMHYGFRPRSPDYLMLNERESPADHLTLIGRLIAKRMTEEHVAHSQFEYFGDPRRLQLIERDAPGGVFPLTTVLARHDGARVMLFQESHDCFADESCPEWLSRIAETERPALLNPRARDGWGPAESRLTALGLGIFPPSLGGIVDYGDYLSATDNVRRRLTRSNKIRFDLPESLARNRDQMLDNEPPLADLVIELVADIDFWLDEQGSYWLRALALFPYVDPGLTVFLGVALVDGGGKSLMDEARFIDLARLPWLRAGRMPDWLRRALVRGLTPSQLETATNAIQAFLLPADQPEGANAIDFSRGEDRGLRKRLLDWLKLTPESVLSEQLLIEALKGRSPDQFGLEAPKALLYHSRSLWTSNEARAVALAIVATIGIGVWQRSSLFPEDTIKQTEIEQPPAIVPTKTPPVQPVVKQPERVPPVNPSTTSPAAEPPAPSKIAPTVEPSIQSQTAPAIDPTARSQTAPPVEPPAPAIDFRDLGPFYISFDSDGAVLTPGAQATLNRVAEGYFMVIKSSDTRNPELIRIGLRGRTGPEQREQSWILAKGMVDSARAYLSSLGIPPRAMIDEMPETISEKGVRNSQIRQLAIVFYSVERAPPTAN